MSISPARIAALVFDFDGTLARLTLDFDEMKERVADAATPFLGHRPEPDSTPVLEWLQGLEDTLRAKPNPGLEGARALHRASHAVIQDMEVEAATEGLLFPFVRPMFKELRGMGLSLGIITRNCARAVQAVFPDADQYCGCLLARDHVDRVKPDPEHLLAALKLLGAEPEQTMMVGDHPMDVETGKRAGTLTGAVASGRIGLEELAQSKPDAAALDCPGLIKVLRTRGHFPD